jgi:sec-independent protein translocase protein TatC
MKKQKPDKNKKTTHKEMPFLDHLEELRWRILRSLGSVFFFTIAAFPLTGFFLDFLTLPNTHLDEPAKLIFLKPTGMLMVRMEVALVTGIIISLPVIFYQLWQFMAPGLLPTEKKFIFPSIIFTTFCFLAGSVFAYKILIPTVLPFLFSMGTDTIDATINITEYISFVLRLILLSGLIFELPVLSFSLSRVGILTPSFMRKYRRYGIVLVFILSALITPPDPMSQILMAFPLIFLYEVSIWVSYIGYRKKKKSDSEWEEKFNDAKSEENENQD